MKRGLRYRQFASFEAQRGRHYDRFSQFGITADEEAARQVAGSGRALIAGRPGGDAGKRSRQGLFGRLHRLLFLKTLGDCPEIDGGERNGQRHQAQTDAPCVNQQVCPHFRGVVDPVPIPVFLTIQVSEVGRGRNGQTHKEDNPVDRSMTIEGIRREPKTGQRNAD